MNAVEVHFIRDRADFLYALALDAKRWPDANDRRFARQPLFCRAVARLTPPQPQTPLVLHAGGSTASAA
ncbi:MAG: hypothetical protein KGI71_05280 [Patescibacteria group bacterium]|nr:hypothetical protein [Patescibacteria group bacterium]